MIMGLIAWRLLEKTGDSNELDDITKEFEISSAAATEVRFGRGWAAAATLWEVDGGGAEGGGAGH